MAYSKEDMCFQLNKFVFLNVITKRAYADQKQASHTLQTALPLLEQLNWRET